MNRTIIRLSLGVLLAAAVASLPAPAAEPAADKSAAEKQAVSPPADTTKQEKPAKGGPFRGKLAAVDKVAKTITVGKRTFQITSETKIKKAGTPALLEDGVVGDPVSGYVKPGAEGKLIATTVNFGGKAPPESSPKQTAAPAEKEKQAK